MIEKIKNNTVNYLIDLGYTKEEAAAAVSGFKRITSQYSGKPSRVEARTVDGKKIELYL